MVIIDQRCATTLAAYNPNLLTSFSLRHDTRWTIVVLCVVDVAGRHAESLTAQRNGPSYLHPLQVIAQDGFVVNRLLGQVSLSCRLKVRNLAAYQHGPFQSLSVDCGMVYDPQCLPTLAGFEISSPTGRRKQVELSTPFEGDLYLHLYEEETILHPFCKLPRDARCPRAQDSSGISCSTNCLSELSQ